MKRFIINTGKLLFIAGSMVFGPVASSATTTTSTSSTSSPLTCKLKVEFKIFYDNPKNTALGVDAITADNCFTKTNSVLGMLSSKTNEGNYCLFTIQMVTSYTSVADCEQNAISAEQGINDKYGSTSTHTCTCP